MNIPTLAEYLTKFGVKNNPEIHGIFLANIKKNYSNNLFLKNENLPKTSDNILFAVSEPDFPIQHYFILPHKYTTYLELKYHNLGLYNKQITRLAQCF